MNWPWSLGSRGQRHLQKQSSFSKPAAFFFSFSLTVKVCVNFFVGPNVMNSPQSMKVSWDSLKLHLGAS